MKVSTNDIDQTFFTTMENRETSKMGPCISQRNKLMSFKLIDIFQLRNSVFFTEHFEQSLYTCVNCPAIEDMVRLPRTMVNR